ncbi:uncharacterized protein ATC70_004550 [Mucor velutinosus]|uniref:Uncharacterized protein n=1 Tax=Mucor velutinosus TaxID=708070 RepID=A0AAN7DTQ3_9FUNG|nr:hypothetical protein ATC70_004550 [Mucor velutinosus]
MSSQYPLPELWTHVVRNKKKGKQKQQQQQNVSFNPTLITPSCFACRFEPERFRIKLNSSTYCYGTPIHERSRREFRLYRLATVKNRTLLDKALVKFNEEAERTDMYENFLGYRKQTRQYLGHHYLETLWLPTSAGRKHLIENGITLEDGTYLKGFPSFPEDANIVHATMEKLPFLPAVQLKKEMAERFSCFGDVLDHGIFKTENGIFQGKGYATLNLTLSHDPRNECMDLHEPGFECNGKRHLEPLNRVIIWDTRLSAVTARSLIIVVPIVQIITNGQFAATAGHVSKNYDRNNAESVPAKVRAVEKSPAKPKERKGAKPTPPKRTDSERRSKPVEDKDHIMPDAPQPNAGSPTPEASQQQTKMTGDTIMEENNTNTKLSDADALNSVSKDVRRSHPEFDPSKSAKKLTRQEGSLDIGDARYQHADTSNPHSDTRRMSGDDTDTIDRNLTPPAPSGTPPSTNL